MKLIIAALVLTSFSANTGLFKSLSKKMEGTWTYDHSIMMIDHEGESEDGWIPVEVTDRIVIEKLSRRKIKFEFESWHSNAHSCGLEGVAVKKGAKFIYIGEKDWDNKTCKLEISLDKKEGIVFKDENLACTRTNCGMRGYMDGASFPDKN